MTSHQSTDQQPGLQAPEKPYKSFYARADHVELPLLALLSQDGYAFDLSEHRSNCREDAIIGVLIDDARGHTVACYTKEDVAALDPRLLQAWLDEVDSFGRERDNKHGRRWTHLETVLHWYEYLNTPLLTIPAQYITARDTSKTVDEARMIRGVLDMKAEPDNRFVDTVELSVSCYAVTKSVLPCAVQNKTITVSEQWLDQQDSNWRMKYKTAFMLGLEKTHLVEYVLGDALQPKGPFGKLIDKFELDFESKLDMYHASLD